MGHLTNVAMNNHTVVLLREESGVAPPLSKKRGSSSTTTAITIKRLDKGQGNQGASHAADIRRPFPLQQPTLQQFSSLQSM